MEIVAECGKTMKVECPDLGEFNGLTWVSLMTSLHPEGRSVNAVFRDVKSREIWKFLIFNHKVDVVVLSFITSCDWCGMHVLRKCCHKQISLLFVQ